MPRLAAVILTFAPLFFQRSWHRAEVLLAGAILAPGRRTLASILRIVRLSRERRFANHHRVLNRTARCPRAMARLLVAAFAPAGPAVLDCQTKELPGINDTIKHRRGKCIAAL